MTEILEEPDSFAKDLKAKKIYLKGANVSSQKEWGSGVTPHPDLLKGYEQTIKMFQAAGAIF